MVRVYSKTKSSINVNSQGSSSVSVASNTNSDINTNQDGNSQRARSWAVGQGLIDGEDYSAKHYAQEAKESEEIASHAIENIDTAKEQALSAIDTEKTEAIADMETAKDEKIGEIEETAAGFEDDLEALTTRAETAATNAETSETNAATSATSASTSATNSAASAETATSAKNDAVSAKNAAAISASKAETYRNQANQYRDDAQNYARQASGSANTASSKAEVAKSYAHGAATASGRAEQAKDAAEGYAEQAEAAKDDIEAELDNYVPNTRKVNNKPLSADITLTASDIGALANSTKYGYSIDLSLNTTNYKLTLTLKDQDGTALNTKTVDFPIESVVVNGSYDSTNQKIVLTLQSGSTIDIPVGDLISGLQSEITATNMLDSDLVDDTNSSHKFATAAQLNQIAINTSSISNLATVATSGDYEDLTNKPTIPTKTSDLTNDSNFASKAWIIQQDYISDITSSDVTTALGYTPYNSTNPNGYQANVIETIKVNNTAQTVTSKAVNITVPTNTNQLTNGAGFITSSALSPYALSSSLATVATSGSYNDLADKPYIPSGVVVDQTFDPTSQAAQSGVAIEGELSTKYVKASVQDEDTGSQSVIQNQGTGINCLLYDNQGTTNRGLYIDSSRAEIYYEDFTGNGYNSVSASDSGVLIYCEGSFEFGDSNGSVTLSTSNNNLAVNGSEVALKSDIPDISTKQDTLVSGTNIKTVNNTSLLGSGNIEVLQNTSNHNNSLCIYGTLVSGMASTEYGTAVGYGTQAGVYANAFGKGAKATGSWAEAFGGNCTASGNWAIRIGHNGDASGQYSIAIGASASASANHAIQLGEGTNSTASSLQIGFGTSNNYTLLDGTTGLIPDARINSALIDGQWVLGLNYTLSNATAIGTYTCDLTSYLPSGNDKYEVLIDCQIVATNSTYVGIKDGTYDNYAFCATGGGRPARNIIAIALTGKTFKYDIAGAALSSGYIRLRGYRRIGTNT